MSEQWNEHYGQYKEKKKLEISKIFDQINLSLPFFSKDLIGIIFDKYYAQNAQNEFDLYLDYVKWNTDIQDALKEWNKKLNIVFSPTRPMKTLRSLTLIFNFIKSVTPTGKTQSAVCYFCDTIITKNGVYKIKRNFDPTITYLCQKCENKPEKVFLHGKRFVVLESRIYNNRFNGRRHKIRILDELYREWEQGISPSDYNHYNHCIYHNYAKVIEKFLK